MVGTGEVCVPGFEPDSPTFKALDLPAAYVPSHYGVISHGVPYHKRSFLTLTIRCVCRTRMYAHLRAWCSFLTSECFYFVTYHHFMHLTACMCTRTHTHPHMQNKPINMSHTLLNFKHEIIEMDETYFNNG